MSEKQESTITTKFKVYRLNLQNLKKSKNYFPRKFSLKKQFKKSSLLQQIPLKVTRSIYKIAKSQKKMFSSQKLHWQSLGVLTNTTNVSLFFNFNIHKFTKHINNPEFFLELVYTKFDGK